MSLHTECRIFTWSNDAYITPFLQENLRTERTREEKWKISYWFEKYGLKIWLTASLLHLKRKNVLSLCEWTLLRCAAVFNNSCIFVTSFDCKGIYKNTLGLRTKLILIDSLITMIVRTYAAPDSTNVCWLFLLKLPFPVNYPSI